MQKFVTFLMVEGKAEEAMTFYTGLFKNSAITNIKRYGASGPGAEGTVLHATFELNGQQLWLLTAPGTRLLSRLPYPSILIAKTRPR